MDILKNSTGQVSLLKKLQIIIDEIERTGEFNEDRIEQLHGLTDDLKDSIYFVFSEQEYWNHKFFSQTVHYFSRLHGVGPSAKKDYTDELIKIYQELNNDIQSSKTEILGHE